MADRDQAIFLRAVVSVEPQAAGAFAIVQVKIPSVIA
jgi:hypothetical protein